MRVGDESKRKRENDLIYHIQLHERAWGTENYPNRPDLADILAANVVVFWQAGSTDERWTITLHDSLKDVEHYLTRLFMRVQAEAPNKRVARIFEKGQRIIIAGVTVHFQPAPE